MQVLIFCELGLKTPVHAPKIGVLGKNRGRSKRAHHQCKMVDSRHLGKIEKKSLRNGLTERHEIWQTRSSTLLTRPTDKISKN